MRRRLTALLSGALLSLVLLPGVSRAQGASVVIDPTQIGVNIENSAQSLSEMIAMLEQMHINNETLKEIWGTGEKIIDVANRFKDAGQLVELTESYNRLLKMATDYARRIDDWKDEEYFDGYERMMRYITRCITSGQKVIEAYQNFFKFFKTNDRDKIDGLEKALAAIQAEIDGMIIEFDDIEFELRLGKDIVSVMKIIEGGSTSSGYAKVYEDLGTVSDTANGWMRFIRLALGFVLFILLVVAVRQTLTERSQPSRPLVRYAVMTVVLWAMLELLDYFLW